MSFERRKWSEGNLKFGNEDLADLLLEDGEKDVGIGFVFVLVSSIREKGCGSYTPFAVRGQKS